MVRCPVHVVCGDATDAMTPRLCERVVGRLPNAILEVMPGLGHFGPLQDPERAVRSMLAFAPRVTRYCLKPASTDFHRSGSLRYGA